MKLSEIRAAGFRGIRSAITVPVTDGFLIVTGRNGAGKSTLVDAVEFALTGQISRPALSPENRENINDYIWWRGTAAPSMRFVRLAFDLGGERRLEVTRRPEGTDYRLFHNSREASSPNGSQLRTYFARETAPQDQLFSRLCSSTIIRDERITELSVDAPEAKRFSLARDTLGSTQLPEVEERLRAAANAIKQQIASREREYELARGEVGRLVTQISEVRSELEAEPDTEAARRHLMTALEVTQNIDTDTLVRRARSWIARTRRSVSMLSRAMPRLQEMERRRVQLETEAYTTRDRELAGVLRQAVEAQERAQIARERAEKVASSFEERQPHVRSLGELVEHGRRLGLEDGRCPLCGTEVDEEQFDSHLRETEGQIEHEFGELSQALSQREDARKAETGAQLRRHQAEATIRDHRRARDELRAEFKEIAREVHGLKVLTTLPTVDAVSVEPVLASVASSLAPVEEALTALETSTTYARLVEQERALAQARERMAAAQRALEAAERARSHQDDATRAVKRVARQLVAERLAQLEPLLVELYERLRPHVQWSTVGYRVRGDVKGFMRLTVGEEDINPRFMFSSGQRRALGLAFLLSVHLSTTWNRWDTLILDDPMQHVDDYRALHLVEVLSSIRRSGRQVLCAVEDQSLATLLARRLATSASQRGSIVQLKYDLDAGSSVASIENVRPLVPRLFTAA